jgi:murein DD-endopeptidase MepM/ murein hydrolase activator NlpD
MCNAKERVRDMDEIIVRPKYSRQTSTQRKKRREPENDLLSTAFAAKLLIVVVFLSVFALCKAANTPATNFFISKVKVIATSNYDVNKYIISIAANIGIKLPQNGLKSENVSDKNEPISEMSSDIKTIEKSSEPNQSTQNSSTSIENYNVTEADTGNASAIGQIQMLDDTEIKAIADKYAFITPIKGDIASTFGTRTDPLSGNAEFHSGIDIEANMGASIKSALGGEVIEVGSKPEYDNYIKIRHIDGIDTIYAHCSILIAKKGLKVNQGDVIAKVGDSEGLSGSYLHFEVWKDNKAVDPEKLLNYLNQ